MGGGARRGLRGALLPGPQGGSSRPSAKGVAARAPDCTVSALRSSSMSLSSSSPRDSATWLSGGVPASMASLRRSTSAMCCGRAGRGTRASWVPAACMQHMLTCPCALQRRARRGGEESGRRRPGGALAGAIPRGCDAHVGHRLLQRRQFLGLVCIQAQLHRKKNRMLLRGGDVHLHGGHGAGPLSCAPTGQGADLWWSWMQGVAELAGWRFQRLER